MKRIASWAFGVSQNVRTTASARLATTVFLIALTIVYHHEPNDITTSMRKTTQETMKSPGAATISLKRWAKPIWDRASALLAAPPAAAGAAAAAVRRMSCSIRVPFFVIDRYGFGIWALRRSELDGDEHVAAHLHTVAQAGVELPAPGGIHCCTVEIAVAAGALHRHF